MTVEELGQRVKAKHPQYASLSDAEIGNRIAAKYPEYRSQLTGRSESRKESLFQRFGKALPIAGSVIGAGRGPVAAFGAASGEAARQLLGRALGEPSPATSGEAAKEIGKEAALGFAGEKAGQIVGRGARAAFQAFPKAAQAFSGSPAINFVRAQMRGAKVFSPGMPRAVAGAKKDLAEKRLFRAFYNPDERVALDMNSRGFANELVENAMKKVDRNIPLTPKEAIGVRRAVDIVFPADTAKAAGLRSRLSTVRSAAKKVIDTSPITKNLSKALSQSERSITASQLRMPLRVNRTNPNQISGLTTTLGPMLGIPALASTIPVSPLAMGAAGAAMGQVRRSIPSTARRGIQRSLMQVLGREVAE